MKKEKCVEFKPMIKSLINPNFRNMPALFISLTVSIVFLIFSGGIRLINPRNVNWIFNGLNSDPVQHYLGWLFYKYDSWKFPVGLNPSYGENKTNSIVYSDSIPIMAIIGKIFSRYVQGDFQYFGIWLMICLTLQSYFAIRIIQLFSQQLIVWILIALFSIMSPILLWRMQVHIALSSHFLILASLFLIFKRIKNEEIDYFGWLAILCAATLIHPYLFGMLLILWVGYVLDEMRKKRFRNVLSYYKVFATILILSLVMTLIAGYDFSRSNSMKGTSVEYGVYRWNPAAPFISYGDSNFFHFSLKGNFETYSYLGAGMMLLIVIALASRSLRNFNLKYHARNNIFQLVAFLSISIFALSNKLSIGPLRLQYPLPPSLTEQLSIFSVSARFIWPTYYCLLFLIIISILKRYNSVPLVTILTFSLILQTYDLVPLSQRLRTYFTSEEKASSAIVLKEEQENILQNGSFKRIVVIPGLDRASFGFPEITEIALKYKLATNSVYVSRVDVEDSTRQKIRINKDLFYGKLRSDTVYVLSPDQYEKYRAGLENNSNMIQIQDFYFVFPTKK